MSADLRDLLAVSGVFFLGLWLHHFGVLREVVVIAALTVVASFVVSFPRRIE